LFTPPSRFGALFPLTDLASSADAIWFSQTTANRIGRFDLATHQFRDYTVPTRASALQRKASFSSHRRSARSWLHRSRPGSARGWFDLAGVAALTDAVIKG
jgi:hypothetical protein